jgi:hypothetical protein
MWYEIDTEYRREKKVFLGFLPIFPSHLVVLQEANTIVVTVYICTINANYICCYDLGDFHTQT